VFRSASAARSMWRVLPAPASASIVITPGRSGDEAPHGVLEDRQLLVAPLIDVVEACWRLWRPVSG